MPQGFHRPSPPFAVPPGSADDRGGARVTHYSDSFQSPTRRRPPPATDPRHRSSQQQCPIVAAAQARASTIVAGRSARPRIAHHCTDQLCRPAATDTGSPVNTACSPPTGCPVESHTSTGASTSTAGVGSGSRDGLLAPRAVAPVPPTLPTGPEVICSAGPRPPLRTGTITASAPAALHPDQCAADAIGARPSGASPPPANSYCNPIPVDHSTGSSSSTIGGRPSRAGAAPRSATLKHQRTPSRRCLRRQRRCTTPDT